MRDSTLGTASICEKHTWVGDEPRYKSSKREFACGSDREMDIGIDDMQGSLIVGERGIRTGL